MSRVSLFVAATFLCGAALAGPPRVVRMAPDHGDTGIDPATTEIRIEFDRDMNPDGRSICGGGPMFPKFDGAPRWDSARVLVIPVTLEPDHQYALNVNCPAAQNFRSAKGEPAEITPLSFKTAKAGEHPDPVPAQTPETNARAIAALRAAIDHRYSYRDRVVKDWDALLAEHQTGLLESKTRAEFARKLGRMLAATHDGHLAVRVGDAAFPTGSDPVTPNIDIRRLPGAIKDFTWRNDVVATGTAAPDVGYILIASWPGDAAALAAAHEALDEMIDRPALIIDVRANGGGDELQAKAFAARFARDAAVYSRDRFRNPEAREGWTGMIDRTISPDDAKGARPYRGRVAVLCGPICMSSNESFILMMREGAKATLIGSRTRGSSGNPRPHDLGNGVTVVLPSWEDLLPDGSPLEGIGIKPDVEAPLGRDGDGVIAEAVRKLKAP